MASHSRLRTLLLQPLNLSGYDAGRSNSANPAGLVDLVGYGAATDANAGSSGSRPPGPGTSNTTSTARKDPKVDTDNNSADFASGAPPEEHRIRRRPGRSP